MPRISYVNGQYVPYNDACVHIEDRGYQFADGIYEVIGCIHGKLADETGHLDRMERSLSEMQMDMPVPRRILQFILREVLRRNKLKNANLYIQVTRGRARRDFKFPAPETPQSLVVIANPFKFDDSPTIQSGVRVITLPDIRWKRRDIKTIALLPQCLAKQKAIDSGVYDAWMVDPDGFVTECSASNAWIVTKDRKLVTRSVSNDILRGVTRTAIQHLCREMNLTIEERAFTPEEAYDAIEAFASSATALITPVIEIDGHKIGDGKPGDVTRNIYAEYRAYADGLKGEQVHWEPGF
ncbi:MAG: D-amino-acid transaminase [Rhodospirillales bacterium]|nr:D-amino-acid transaminase [Alphaproteobacteria bacterium]USO03347.1 MAG: D-amino-acid transaminase [Rhodospirillales bacterium]